MKNTRLAEIFAIKYKVAAAPADIEIPLRKKLIKLWEYPNRLFNIIKACADSDPSKGKGVHDNKSYAGYKFCKDVVDTIDHLKKDAQTISLGEMRDKLLHLSKIIEEQKNQKFSPKGNPATKGDDASVQFPHVAELIFQLLPVARRHDKTQRDGLQSKARTGLSRIHSFTQDLLKDLQELEVMTPEKFTYEGKEDINRPISDRFTPQRGVISNHDITDFIRQYGPSYGIDSRETWNSIVESNPQLKEELVTVINALNRGQAPSNDWQVRQQIAKSVLENQELQQATTPNFSGPQ